MKSSRTTAGLIVAVVAAFSFGTSGALIKPLLEAGWSPAAAVTVRALIGGVVLLPFAIVLLRGKWAAVRRARWRIVIMALVGVAGTQLVYFAAVQRIPVSTAILLEYMAPVLLVGFAWVATRRMPKPVVLIGTVIAIVGLVLVVSPGGSTSFDPVGVVFAVLAMIGCAVYYVLAAKPSDGLPPVALACFGLLGGALSLGVVGLIGIVPFTATFGSVALLGSPAPWWVPLLIVGVMATAIAYAASITASEMLGSRLASFAGLLEVVAAALYAWILLGEGLSVLQLVGGLVILAGIAFVRSERLEPEEAIVQVMTGPIAVIVPLTVEAWHPPIAETAVDDPTIGEAAPIDPLPDEAATVEPATNGSATVEPATNGSGTDEPATNGPATDGPATVEPPALTGPVLVP